MQARAILETKKKAATRRGRSLVGRRKRSAQLLLELVQHLVARQHLGHAGVGLSAFTDGGEEFAVILRRTEITGAVKLASQIRSNGQTYSLEQTSLKADGNVYEGTLALTRRDGRPLLSGTLATDQLTLNPFLSDLPDFLTAEGNWSQNEIRLFDSRTLDLDLRLSASLARLQKIQIKNAGMGVCDYRRSGFND